MSGPSESLLHIVGVSCKKGARLHPDRALVRLGTKSERLTIAGPRARQSYAVAIPRVVHRCKARVQDEPPGVCSRVQKRPLLDMRGCSGSVCQRALPVTLARRRRTDDHRFILVGQALWAGIVPTWFFSRAFGDRPAQGFRSRPWLPRVVADVFDLGPARTVPQDDFRAIADQHHGETLPRIRLYVARDQEPPEGLMSAGFDQSLSRQ